VTTSQSETDRPLADQRDPGPEVAAQLTRTLALSGVVSVAAGTAWAITQRSQSRVAFGQQSAMWGAVNLAIAGVGAWRARHHPAEAGPLRRTLLINAGLDVGYIAAGAHLVYHRSTLGGRVTRDAALGHGLAVVVQGTGLLKLDLYYAWRLSR
jgi:hypothetical protein